MEGKTNMVDGRSHGKKCNPKRNQSFSTYANFSEKLTFLTPWYVHVRKPFLRFIRFFLFRADTYPIADWNSLFSI